MRELPVGEGWQYEPKWDGFRGVLENLDGELRLWSRNARPLLRYFPELRPLGERLPPRSALDGEIVIEREGALDFDALQMRLHPAESRINRLSEEMPAGYVVFDVLLWQDEEVHLLPLDERRARVESLPFEVSPATSDESVAREWMEQARRRGLRRRRREAARQPVPPGLARRRRQGEAPSDGGLRRRGREAVRRRRAARDAPARVVRGGRRAALRRLCGSRAEARAGDRGPRVAAPRGRSGPAVLGAEPLGHRRSRGGPGPARARRRGAL